MYILLTQIKIKFEAKKFKAIDELNHSFTMKKHSKEPISADEQKKKARIAPKNDDDSKNGKKDDKKGTKKASESSTPISAPLSTTTTTTSSIPVPIDPKLVEIHVITDGSGAAELAHGPSSSQSEQSLLSPYFQEHSPQSAYHSGLFLFLLFCCFFFL